MKLYADKINKYINEISEKENDSITRIYFRLMEGSSFQEMLYNWGILRPLRPEEYIKKQAPLDEEYLKKKLFYSEFQAKIEAGYSKGAISRWKTRMGISSMHFSESEPPKRGIRLTRQKNYYSKAIKKMLSVGFIMKSRRCRGRQWYKTNPKIIPAFVRRYSLSEQEFKLLLNFADELESKFRAAYVLGSVGPIGRFKTYIRDLRVTLNFKQTLRHYLSLSDDFTHTERELPINEFRPFPEFIEYNPKENTLCVWDKDLDKEFISMASHSLFLTWLDLDIYIDSSNLLLTGEDRDRILDWFLLNLITWERHRLEIGMEKKGQHPPVIDLQFIRETDGHFLKSFDNWEEKLNEALGRGWVERVCSIGSD